MIRAWRSPGRLALVGIVLAAAYLRLAHLDLAELRREEAWNLLAAADLAAGRALPLTGMGTSVAGLENGPALVYLLALPLLVARDAALASAFVASTNVAALGVVALLARRVFGWPAALFGAAAYAVGSWAVYFSRKIWPNDPMPLFSALLALGLYLAVVAGRGRGLILAGLSLGVLLNLHPSSFALVPFVGLALLLRPALLRTQAAWIGLAAVTLVSTPFLLHEVRGGFPSVPALLGVAGGPARLDLNAFVFAAELVGPGAYPTVVGGAIEGFRARALPWTGLDVALAAALALGVVTAVGRLVAALRVGSRPSAVALCLLWLLVPLLVSTRRSLPLWNHYFIFLLPCLFMFVGVGLARLGRVVPIALLTWAAIVQVWGFEAFVATLRAEGARTIYGVPAAFQRAAAETALRLAGPAPIVLVSQPGPGAPDGIDDLLPVWRFLIPEARALRFDDGGGMVRLGPGPALYVVAPEADPVVETILADHGRSAGPEQPLPGSPRGYRYWLAAATTLGDPLGQLEGGLALQEVRGLDPGLAGQARPGAATAPCRLADATWRPAGAPTCLPRLEAGELVVSASFRVGARRPEAELAFFSQVVDDRGQRLAGRDRAGVEAARLEPGDEVVTWGRMAVPGGLAPGRYWLALGARPAGQAGRLGALDPAGRPAGDLLRVGPLKVPLPAAAPEAGTRVEHDAPNGPSLNPQPSTLNPLARFDDGISLEAARLPALTWRAEARPSRDYTVFVHLLDPAGRLVGQDDRPPVDGSYPTSIWEVGERILDPHPLRAPPGRYRVVVGMYDPAGGQRLRRVDGSGDSVDVGTLEIKE